MLPEEEAVRLLKEKKLVAAFAESCTGGLISKRLTDVSGCSEVFNCGIVSYGNEIKTSVLGVKKETLDKFGAVSEQTVREMVSGVLKLSRADVAAAVSGIAGPSSDDTLKPVGLIYIAVSDGKNIKVECLHNNFSENVRENNRKSAADKALLMLIEMVGEKA